jgi:uncharacterized membrane protein YoaK (UPF0700 family)
MLLALTWAAGSVDAISYFGLGHVFTAMMTGNTVLLGLALAQGEVLAALRSILALTGFSIGVFFGASIVERESEPPDWPAAVTAALAFETIIVGIFAAISLAAGATREPAVTYLLILLLAVAMGVQSAAVRRLGVPGIATTYITGTLTSLMVDLLGWLRSMITPIVVERGSVEPGSSVPWEQRVGLLAAVVGLYCFGAFVGGILEVRASRFVSLLPFLALLLVVINAVVRQRHHSPQRF